MKKGTKFTATYRTAVYKPMLRDWRQETVYAELVAVSEKMATVVSATLEPASSNRQQFHAEAIALRETGTRKRISSLSDIVEIA